jgi:hypothetical protein
MYDYNKYPIENFIGKTLKKIKVGDDYIVFHTTDKEIVRMQHDQDCCEDVKVVIA